MDKYEALNNDFNSKIKNDDLDKLIQIMIDMNPEGNFLYKIK